MKKAIVTIHGIKTSDMTTWQDKFRFFAKSQNVDVKVFNFEYGYLLGIFAFWMNISNELHFPDWITKRVVGQFLKFLRDRMAEFPDYEFSILAHSMGTWISYKALCTDEKIKIANYVLVGGVISSHQEKTFLIEWLEQGRLKSVHAWSSHNDSVVAYIAQGFGKLGARGFVRRDHEEDMVAPAPQPYPPYALYNHFTNEDHGGVLRDLGKYGTTLFAELTA